MFRKVFTFFVLVSCVSPTTVFSEDVLPSEVELQEARELVKKYGETSDKEMQAVVDKAFPMSAEKLQQMKRLMDDYKRLVESPERDYNYITRAVPVDVSPGSKIPKVYFKKDAPLTLAFLDANSNPWQITGLETSANISTTSASIDMKGNPIVNPGKVVVSNKVEASGSSGERSSFTNSGQPVSMGYFLTITPSNYKHGIVTVYLKGAKVPVTIQVSPADKDVDVRVELIVNALQPGAFTANGGFSSRAQDNSPSQSLLNVLMGISPDKAYKKMVLSDPESRGWKKSGEGFVYIRTRLKLLTPETLGESKSIKGVDGTYAYKLPYEFPILAIDNDGETVFIREHD